MLIALLFFSIPAVCIGLLFLRDDNKKRKYVLNAFLILNDFVFMIPISMAFLFKGEGQSMWDENSGGGVFMWYYLILLPICAMVLFALAVLKIIFTVRSSR